jgi:hypothetical protein
MDRFAVFVDAGYLFAAGAQAIAKKHVSRRDIKVPFPDKFVAAIINSAGGLAAAGYAVPPALLRVYWYDALLGPRPSMDQAAIAHTAGVKLRLGSMNNAGEQKGVDSLIVTDIIELARNRALTDAVLISGDEDLRIAIQVAQTYGVRAHILAVGDPSSNVSPTLQMEADSVGAVDGVWVKQYIEIVDTKSRAATPAGAATKLAAVVNNVDVDAAAARVSDELLQQAGDNDVPNLQKHFESNKTVPPEYDGRLIAKTAAVLKRHLTPEEKRVARGVFVRRVRAAK